MDNMDIDLMDIIKKKECILLEGLKTLQKLGDAPNEYFHHNKEMKEIK